MRQLHKVDTCIPPHPPLDLLFPASFFFFLFYRILLLCVSEGLTYNGNLFGLVSFYAHFIYIYILFSFPLCCNVSIGSFFSRWGVVALPNAEDELHGKERKKKKRLSAVGIGKPWLK